jgi:photosystem II stability/assembly factor-like uncharacterized protein
MRGRRLILAAISVGALAGAAGCTASTGTASTGTARTGTASTGAAAPRATAVSAPSRPSQPCHGKVDDGLADDLFDVQFVSATQGWVVGTSAILATTDGGAHWTTQLSGSLNLGEVDFVNGQDGWAVGTTSLLATTDGGVVWTPLPEPCPVVGGVDFFSPSDGYALSGDGGILVTGDGGHSWSPVATPSGVQTVCFSDARHGWLGANGRLYRTSDGGRQWTVLTPSDGYPSGAMTVECAADGSAWALRDDPRGTMNSDAHTGFHASQSGATEIFETPSPGPLTGPFAVISPSTAAFVGNCNDCGAGTAPWDLATNSGATLVREGNVGDVNFASAASFVSPGVGFVLGFEQTSRGSTTRIQQRVVATTDGGRTWHIAYAGPWTTSG